MIINHTFICLLLKKYNEIEQTAGIVYCLIFGMKWILTNCQKNATQLSFILITNCIVV